jgi:V-type H+-transporting ATPase subunit D
LKKVSNKKQKDAAAEEAARQAAKEANENAGEEAADAVESKDLLGDEDNQDVIF